MKKPQTLDEFLKPRGSLSRLASDLGISVTYLCEIRKRRRTPALPLALALAKRTGLPVTSFVQR